MSLETRIVALAQAIGADIKALKPETGPALTYTAGVLTRVDYDSGGYKLFTYTAGVLTQLDYVAGGVTTRKTFNYNPDGSLASVDQGVI